jgi:hypothetical protein
MHALMQCFHSHQLLPCSLLLQLFHGPADQPCCCLWFCHPAITVAAAGVLLLLLLLLLLGYPPVCEEEVLVEWPCDLKAQALKDVWLQSHCRHSRQQAQRTTV